MQGTRGSELVGLTLVSFSFYETDDEPHHLISQKEHPLQNHLEENLAASRHDERRTQNSRGRSGHMHRIILFAIFSKLPLGIQILDLSGRRTKFRNVILASVASLREGALKAIWLNEKSLHETKQSFITIWRKKRKR